MTRIQSTIILAVTCVAGSAASSRGPPPPPPPSQNRNYDEYNRPPSRRRDYDDSYNDRRNDYYARKEQRNNSDQGRYSRRESSSSSQRYYNDYEYGNKDEDYTRDYENDYYNEPSYQQNENMNQQKGYNDEILSGYDELSMENEDSTSRTKSVPFDVSRKESFSTLNDDKPGRKESSGFSLFQRSKLNEKDDADLNEGEQETEKKYNPIDYQFPSKDITESPPSQANDVDDEEKLPQTGDAESEEISKENRRKNREVPTYASARNDAIARYTASPLGKVKLAISTFLVGGICGGFIGQSMLNSGKQFALMMGVFMWLISFFRNDYGEMSRSLGLALIYLLRRTKSVRRRYRTGPHVRSMCRIQRRHPFPPVMRDEDENPWKYEPERREDPKFDMTKALLSMVLIGSFCGGNIPLIPTWMGGAGGAAAFGVFGIGKNARGDLIRTMGMRIVALSGEALQINRDLRVAGKVSRVAGKVFDKMMILDRKHKIKDRIVSGATWAYDRVTSTAARVQQDMQEGNESDRRSDNRREMRAYDSDRTRRNDDRAYDRDDRRDLRGDGDDRRYREDDDRDRRVNGNEKNKKKSRFFS